MIRQKASIFDELSPQRPPSSRGAVAAAVGIGVGPAVCKAQYRRTRRARARAFHKRKETHYWSLPCQRLTIRSSII
eukprot:6195935-Pleurochrysis_carterae.AAC.1